VLGATPTNADATLQGTFYHNNSKNGTKNKKN